MPIPITTTFHSPADIPLPLLSLAFLSPITHPSPPRATITKIALGQDRRTSIYFLDQHPGTTAELCASFRRCCFSHAGDCIALAVHLLVPARVSSTPSSKTSPTCVHPQALPKTDRSPIPSPCAPSSSSPFLFSSSPANYPGNSSHEHQSETVQ